MSETRTLTLSEFLLARIAEDEDERNVDLMHWMFDYSADDKAEAARWKAECEAKRRIVELHAPLDGGTPEEFPLTSPYTGKLLYPECGECGYSSQPDCPTLRLLALPYADHPDYREEWRP